MKFNKVKHLLSLICLLTILAVPVLTQALPLDNPLGPGVTFEKAVSNVINAALGVSGVLALIAFIYGGVTWMISGGDTSKIQKGRAMMTWAVWGIVIIFSSYAILNYIFTALVGGGGSGDTSAINPTD
ncbi:MAG: pilin [Candidatus Buchananbacteria bacterium]|nr:pilin [Candidatus Buchananbacteria bacterium]